MISPGLALRQRLRRFESQDGTRRALPRQRWDAQIALLGRRADARAEFERAVTLTQNARERSVLLERVASCSARG